jgi:hypothetical protein
MAQTLGCETITTQQETIANLARQAPGMVLTTLAHHLQRYPPPSARVVHRAYVA